MPASPLHAAVRAAAFVAIATAFTFYPAQAATSDARAGFPDGLYAEFEMPSGSLTAELFYDRVPLTVANFVGRAEGTLPSETSEPFYTGLRWYRVVPHFVIQSGDPTFAPNKPDDPTPDPAAFPDEFAPGLHHDSAGVLSMANAGPDTNTCEFFITLRDTTRLNYLHTVFGRVVRGAERLDQIKPDERIVAVRILRIGRAARAFRADAAIFAQLRAAAKRYAGSAEPGSAAHFDDPDHLLPAEPPRARNFNFKLANFERATGIKVCARVFAKNPTTAGATPATVTAALAKQLQLPPDAALAVLFADTRHWELWFGRTGAARLVRGRATDEAPAAGTVERATQALLAGAASQADLYTAEATQAAPPGVPVSDAQRLKYRVDAVLDALLLKLEPRVATGPLSPP